VRDTDDFEIGDTDNGKLETMTTLQCVFHADDTEPDETENLGMEDNGKLRTMTTLQCVLLADDAAVDTVEDLGMEDNGNGKLKTVTTLLALYASC
jgi:hypothetical protein